jgi:hypothetical protein
MTATLRVERSMPMGTMAVVDRSRPWQILLDGRAVGTIERDGVFETGVEPGAHTLQLISTGSRRSPERSFTAAENTVTEFACHSQPIWPLMLMALVVPGRWIALKQR